MTRRLLSVQALTFILFALTICQSQGSAAASLPRSTFFRIRQDFRKCASPLCGGFFVSQVNRGVTRCANGVLQTECYVAALRPNVAVGGSSSPVRSFFGELGIVRGKVAPKNFPGFGNLGEFIVEDFFKLASSSMVPSGPERGFFVRLRSTGVSCITAPCFNIKEVILNTGKMQTISDTELTGTGATPEEVERAQRAKSGSGLIAFGDNRVIRSGLLAGDEVVFVARKFYLRSCDQSV